MINHAQFKALVADRLDRDGHQVRIEVQTEVGAADLVTESAVYEVRSLLTAESLPRAVKVGRNWLIDRESVKEYKALEEKPERKRGVKASGV